MKTRLNARFTLKSVYVSAELGVEQRRPDLAMLCRATTDTLTPALVLQRVPTLDQGGAERIVSVCRQLGLVDDTARLTDAGRRCARDGTALIPESGLYALVVGKHPSVGCQLFGFARVAGHWNDRRTDDLMLVRDHLDDFTPTDRHTDLFHEGRQFALRRLHAPAGDTARCRVVEDVGEGHFEWELDLATGQNTQRIAVKTHGAWAPESREDPRRTTGQVTRTLAPVDGAFVRGLFASWDPKWSTDDGFVRVRDDGTSPAEETFRRTRRYTGVPVQGRGTFQNVDVADVPIGPESAAAAEGWARRLHRERLSQTHGYLSLGAVEQLFDETITGTPLEAFGPTLPEIDVLIDSLAADPKPPARKASARLAAVRDITWNS